MANAPPVAPIRVPSVEIVLRDGQLVSKADYTEASQFSCQFMKRFVQKTRASVSFCETHLGPDLIDDESRIDPDLFVISFVVYEERANQILGMFHLYNMMIEATEDDVIGASAMPHPACRGHGDFSKETVWRLTMRHLLGRDFKFMSGRPINLLAWRFPLRAGHRWQDAPGESFAGSVITDLSSDNTLTTRGDGAPIEIRFKEPDRVEARAAEIRGDR